MKFEWIKKRRNFSTRFRVALSFCLFLLCVLCAFARNSFSQTNLDALAVKIRDGTIEEKRDALLQVRNLESAEASRIALPSLSDASEIVRATAAFSVIFLPKDEAALFLSPLLQDKFELVRCEAVYALGKVKNPSSVSSLVGILQKDKIAEVRAAAAIALGEIGNAGAVDALTKILRQPATNKDEFLQRSAARSLGQIAQANKPNESNTFRDAVAALIQILQNPKAPPDAKREAAAALGAIGDRSAIPVLEANLGSKDYYLAAACKEALKKINAEART